MKDCNQTATVWNRWRDSETEKDVFKRAVLPVPVKWKQNIQRGINGSTATIVDSVIVIIPHSDGHLPPNEWNGSTDKFTLQTGDIIAIGTQTVEITGEKPYTASEVKASLSPDAIVIKSVQDNTKSARGKHWRIEGL